MFISCFKRWQYAGTSGVVLSIARRNQESKSAGGKISKQTCTLSQAGLIIKERFVKNICSAVSAAGDFLLYQALTVMHDSPSAQCPEWTLTWQDHLREIPATLHYNGG